jgi:hypothetical protein
MEVELEDFENGRPMIIQASEEVIIKIKALKAKRQYKELLELANTLPNNK